MEQLSPKIKEEKTKIKEGDMDMLLKASLSSLLTYVCFSLSLSVCQSMFYENSNVTGMGIVYFEQDTIYILNQRI